ncbi:MAG: rhodanese-like domain-containing protein [Rhodocyclaceae bacterium]|nr:rhodanese-like domain-containing protein [Rhodocyclaceae bacterium]
MGGGRLAAVLVWGLLAGVTPAANAADKPVGLTADVPAIDVLHEGRLVRVVRDPDNLATIEPDYTLTSRPCPPYCILPMQLAPGVETLGELELFEVQKRLGRPDADVLLIDSRDAEWLQRSGLIPGAIHVPWTALHPKHAEGAAIAEILELRFGAIRNGVLWDFSHAKTLVLYCNGAWCGQSPTNIKQLLALGYPAHKLKWYRGGMQAWKSLGLTTVPVK